MNDLERIEMQADVLYVHDSRGRLLRVNEPDPNESAARFFLGRTRSGNIWRVGHDVEENLAAELERLAAAEPVLQDLRQPPAYLTEYTSLLQPRSIYSGPAYYLPPLDPPTGAVVITQANRHLLQAYYPYLYVHLDERAPVVVMVVGGAAIAACCTARYTLHAAEAGVDTVEGYRGRGYAVQTVRGWAAATRALGRLPLYSTSWDNTASQAVAAKLGAVLYGVDFGVT